MSFPTMGSVRMALDFFLAGFARSIDSSGYSHSKADHRSTPSRSVRDSGNRVLAVTAVGVHSAGFEPRSSMPGDVREVSGAEANAGQL